MKLIIPLLVCASILASFGADPKKNPEGAMLSVEISKAISEVSGRELKELPKLPETTRLLHPIQKDSEGSQFWFKGDCIPELKKVFSEVYGPVPYARTNKAGKVTFGYGPLSTGVSLICQADSIKSGNYTHLVIVKPDPRWMK